MAVVRFHERKLIDRAAASGIEWLNRVLHALERDIKLSMPGAGIRRSDIGGLARRATRDSMGLPQKGGIPKVEAYSVDAEMSQQQRRQRLADNRRLTRQLRDNYRTVLAENTRRLKKFERITRHSLPGNPPHRQTGTLVRSITVDSAFNVTGNRIVGRVGTNLPYGKYLELGTSRIKARPYLRPGLRRMHARIRKGEFPFNRRIMDVP